jgi:N-acyl-L-homoserine lactone synthetase
VIKLIQGASARLFPGDIDAMFRSRARIFSERLGWHVVVKDEYERDRFDDENPLYLISVDPCSGEYLGSVRLLPTTGPNMLRDVFPFLLRDGDVIESATIWESSRICAISADEQPKCSRGYGNYVLAELLAGMADVAALAGLTQIVAVFDARILRVLKSVRCKPQIIGTPRRIGETMSYAGVFDVGCDAFQRTLRSGLGIDGSVLAPGAKELVKELIQ